MLVKEIELGGRKYRVSDTGKVYSMLGFEIKQRKNPKGYLYFSAGKDGQRKQYRTHRIVAKLFVPNPHNYPEVDHKDGNPSNASANNLRWCTHQQNVDFSKERGMFKNNGVGEKNPKALLTEAKVINMRIDHANGMGFAELAKKYGCSRKCAYSAATRRTWKHIA